MVETQLNDISYVVTSAGFSLLKNKLPENMPESMKTFLIHVRNTLEIKKPKGVIAAIALPTLNIRWESKHVNLLVLGSFRGYYAVIERLARALSSLVLDFETLPQIKPLSISDIKLCKSDPSFMKTIRRSGTVIFYLETHDE